MQGCLGFRSDLRLEVVQAVNKAQSSHLILLISAALCDQMWKGEPAERLAAIGSLGQLFATGVITEMKETILAILACRILDQSETVRESAVLATGKFTVPDYNSILEIWKADPSAEIKAQCETLLAKSKDAAVKDEFASLKISAQK